VRTIDDIGGDQGWGTVSPPDPNEAVFDQRWQGRAFALTLLSLGRISGQNLDAFRRALGDLDHGAYFDDGYYGRWLNASEAMLVQSGIIAPGAIDTRVRRNQGEDVADLPEPEPSKPDYAPTGPGSLRTVDEAPAFAVGDRVRAKDDEPTGRHTRLTGYVRGKSGVVEVIQPAHLLPDTHAYFLGENPQHVYTVRFDSHELWGPAADRFTLTIELFESYLEPAS
jgi:nitrile hydratase